MDLKHHARNILFDIFGIQPGERFLLLSEQYDPKAGVSERDAERWQKLNILARQFFQAVQEVWPDAELLEYPTTGGHGKHPNLATWEKVFGHEMMERLDEAMVLDAILHKTQTPEQEAVAKEYFVAAERKYDVIMALTNFSTSHTLFRKFFTNAQHGRYASMPSFDPKMFETSMTENWAEMREFSHKFAKYLYQFDAFRITASNGTDITIVRDGRGIEPDDGNLSIPGAFGNLPAGEVYFAPMEGKSFGKLVLDYAPTRTLTAPVTVTVENGEIVSIDGDEPYAAEMREKIGAHPNNKNVAELGLGVNRAACIVDNILESEKIYGSIHIAFGDNRSFGGNTTAPFHEDYLVLVPNLYGIKNGKETLVISEKMYYIDAPGNTGQS